MDKFTYNWKLTDLEKVKKNGFKVFSTFACAGGSTMGYKMSGFEVLGCNEIDPEMISIYKANHNPKYAYLEPIQTFKDRTDIPKELYNLDILDGSPPCSSFSMAGKRAKDWGKNKHFREGQAKQVLDDLFFHFIDLANKLRPKIVVAENVKGMLVGHAKGYVKQVINLLNTSGYEVQLFLLNGATMGLPQRRERVFFVCRRKDLNLPKLSLGFNEKPIPIKEAIKGINEIGKPLTKNSLYYWKQCQAGKSFATVHPKGSLFNYIKLSKNRSCNTITGHAEGTLTHWDKPNRLSPDFYKRIGSFPMDYKFKKESNAAYTIGMSVPPLMMHKISEQIAGQWLSKL